jgi:hypothetical protein
LKSRNNLEFKVTISFCLNVSNIFLACQGVLLISKFVNIPVGTFEQNKGTTSAIYSYVKI